MRKNATTIALLAFIPLLLGISLASLAVGTAMERKARWEGGVQVAGSVTEVNEQEIGVTFALQNGGEVSATILPLGTSSSYHLDDKVNILYRPENPTVARFGGFWGQWFHILLMVAGSVLLLVIGTVLFCLFGQVRRSVPAVSILAVLAMAFFLFALRGVFQSAAFLRESAEATAEVKKVENVKLHPDQMHSIYLPVVTLAFDVPGLTSQSVEFRPTSDSGKTVEYWEHQKLRMRYLREHPETMRQAGFTEYWGGPLTLFLCALTLLAGAWRFFAR